MNKLSQPNGPEVEVAPSYNNEKLHRIESIQQEIERDIIDVDRILRRKLEGLFGDSPMAEDNKSPQPECWSDKVLESQQTASKIIQALYQKLEQL
jgi:hypothetical protein